MSVLTSQSPNSPDVVAGAISEHWGGFGRLHREPPFDVGELDGETVVRFNLQHVPHDTLAVECLCGAVVVSGQIHARGKLVAFEQAIALPRDVAPGDVNAELDATASVLTLRWPLDGKPDRVVVPVVVNN